MRVRAVFPQINTLPGSQGQLALADGQREIDAGQRGADVRGHVVIAFGSVDEERIAVGHQPRKKGFEVAAHIGVGIFLDQKRRRSMAQVQGEQAVAEFAGADKLFNFAGEFNQSAPTGGDDNLVKRLAHGNYCAPATGAPFAANSFSRSGLRGCPASSAFW
jgi:hypothetical protein